MPNNEDSLQTYGQVKQRLDQIVEEVSAQDISLDDALALYEEAVKLGQRASSLIEDDALSQKDDAGQDASQEEASA